MGLFYGAIRMITVVATGGFDPIHSGHIKYLEEASLCGTQLVVGVNSDTWLKRKKYNFDRNQWEQKNPYLIDYPEPKPPEIISWDRYRVQKII